MKIKKNLIFLAIILASICLFIFSNRVNAAIISDDGKYTLRVAFGTNSWNSCRIAVHHNQTHSLITEIYYDTQSKITKKDAKNIADFAFLAWNTRERKIK